MTLENKISTACLLATVLVPAASTSVAAEAGDESTIQDVIVVTATRSPYSIDKVPYRTRVISAEEIARSAVTSVEELLRSEGSLQVRDSTGNGRDVRISVRGMSAGSNAVVLVDGRRLNNSDLSEPDLTSIVLQDIDRIEVLEGGAGALFGDQAVGGVINVITHAGGEPGGEVALGSGSFDARNLRASFRGNAADERVDFLVSSRWEEADGYRDETEVDYTNLRGEAGYSYGNGRAFIELQHTENGYLLPGALMDFEVSTDRRQAGSSFNDYDIDSDLSRVGLTHSFVEELDFLASLSRREEDVAILGNSISFGSSQTYQAREVETFDPRFVLALGNWRVTIGGDIENYDYDLEVNSSFGPSISSHRHERRSTYLQGIYSPTEALQLSAGYRHAEVDVDVDGGDFIAGYDDDVSVMQLGASYRASDRLRLYLNRDETFRFPLADENVDFLGNVVALEAQEGLAWELGGEWQQGELEIGLALFDHAIENEIGYDTVQFANVNFDDTRRRGVTVDAALSLTDAIDISGAFTNMKAEFDAGPLDGNRLTGVSESHGKLALDYRFDERWRAHGEVIYTGSVAVDERASVESLDSYTVVNMAVTYEWDAWSIQARLNNLFGKEYSELVTFFGFPSYFPSPEINGHLSLQYNF